MTRAAIVLVCAIAFGACKKQPRKSDPNRDAASVAEVRAPSPVEELDSFDGLPYQLQVVDGRVLWTASQPTGGPGRVRWLPPGATTPVTLAEVDATAPVAVLAPAAAYWATGAALFVRPLPEGSTRKILDLDPIVHELFVVDGKLYAHVEDLLGHARKEPFPARIIRIDPMTGQLSDVTRVAHNWRVVAGSDRFYLSGPPMPTPGTVESVRLDGTDRRVIADGLDVKYYSLHADQRGVHVADDTGILRLGAGGLERIAKRPYVSVVATNVDTIFVLDLELGFSAIDRKTGAIAPVLDDLEVVTIAAEGTTIVASVIDRVDGGMRGRVLRLRR